MFYLLCDSDIGDLATQVGVGGCVAYIIIKEVFSFLRLKGSNGNDKVTRRECDDRIALWKQLGEELKEGQRLTLDRITRLENYMIERNRDG